MVIGIDVAANRLNVVALSQHANLVGGGVVQTDDLRAVEGLISQAEVIAIDAPRELSSEPHREDKFLKGEKFRHARCAEVALGRTYGTWVPWVSPSNTPSDGWIATGLSLYDRLKSASANVIEVFPHAAFRSLVQPARLAKKTSAEGIQQRVQLLRELDFGVDGLEMWSHDSLDAAVAAFIALDHSHGSAVPVGCGHDKSQIWLPAAASRLPLVQPAWPAERFFLISIPDGMDLGLFEPEDWAVAEDGSLFYLHDGKPIGLRVHRQDGMVLHANNGSATDRSWEILPLSKAPEELKARVAAADVAKATHG